MSRCKAEMIAAGAETVPRTCPVHGLYPCPEVITERQLGTYNDGRIEGLETAKTIVDTVCQIDRMLTDDEARLVERINEVLDSDIAELREEATDGTD